MLTATGGVEDFLAVGWTRFAACPELLAWIEHSRAPANQALHDPRNAEWLRCGGTWFAGVNALANDQAGAVKGGPRLYGAAVDFISAHAMPAAMGWDRGQVSICYPGYPARSADETDASHRFRLKRDAAHVDGLLLEEQGKRRFIREYHAFILGIPLDGVEVGMSPFVVWEGSHRLVREAFKTALAGCPPERWHEVDMTDIYQATRRRIGAVHHRLLADPI